MQKSKIKCHYCGKFGHFRRECRYSTTASSGASNRRSREYRTSPKLRRHPPVSSSIGSPVSSEEFHYNAFRGGRRDRNCSFKDQNDLNRYHGSTNFVAHRNEGVVNENSVEFPIEGKDEEMIPPGREVSQLDDYSRRIFIFPMCHKLDTNDILVKFIIRAEMQLGLKVKAVRWDIGGEFIASILTVERV
ncbi:hypothetical protein TNCV_733611 [Trichonephila clavipes]|nr:hypothetical protein TNCV_733611 [Trichonephila clavipes]